jgi:urease accessory protein
MNRTASRILTIALLTAPTAALAHTGHGDTAGFAHGFTHPLGGLDHILAMVAVGVFAYQLGGRALWMVPSTFVLVMALGGLLGMADVWVPHAEVGIAVSVVVLGAVIAFGVRAPVAIAMGLAGLFAIFHGYAHGAEMPAAGSGASYAAGFLLATAMLHAAGIGLGLLVGRLSASRGHLTYRIAGSLTAVAGVLLLTHVI